MQVDKLEVPFIWAYRRDYQHPVMTREHLWYIFALEEEWDAQVDRKVRLGEEVAAVADAANAFQGSAEEGEVRTVAYQRLLSHYISLSFHQ